MKTNSSSRSQRQRALESSNRSSNRNSKSKRSNPNNTVRNNTVRNNTVRTPGLITSNSNSNSNRSRHDVTLEESSSDSDSDSSSDSTLQKILNPHPSHLYPSDTETDSDAFSLNNLALSSHPTSHLSASTNKLASKLSKNLKTSKMTNAHLTATLTTLQNEIRTLKNNLHTSKSSLSKLSSLEAENSSLKIKLKEYNYENRKLQNTITRLQTSKKKSDQRTSASLNGLKSALLTVESIVTSRSKSTLSHLKKLSTLQTNFVRHLKNGYSNTPSHVAYEMLENMSRTLSNLREALETCDIGVSSMAGETAKNVARANIEGEGGNGMKDIWEEVERENGRLRREMERLKEEVEADRVEREQSSRLLPEYRLEIVRARSAKETVERELKEERGTVRELQRRLDECVLALRSAERDRLELARARGRSDNSDNIAVDEYYPPRKSSSPTRWSVSDLPSTTAKKTLSSDEELFASLLQKSNDKLLLDLKETVETNLETVVKRQTEFIMSRSIESESSEKS
ncbi:hypothetical protein TrST_g12752 [Triparma strigata]|uniref:Uncharacterized protein n=1 Tax=Triparma strigata TaxID=1606541 RepID=A0A9W7C6E2_9STRA|nr:hypothetical protein TrST_g12752 [Triparma strigata]